MKKIITVYHGIGNRDKFMEINFNKFIEQINYLIKKNYNFCTVSEILKATKGKNISIMFDDGLASSYKAIKYLEKNKIKYSLALIEDFIEKKDYLKMRQINKLKYAELCFHTKHHQDLTRLNSKQLQEELTITNSILCKKIVVYPMGKFNNKVLNIMQKKNYQYGLTVLPFHLSSRNKKYEIPRICINGFQSNFKYKFFLTKVGNVYLHLAFLKRKILKQNYLDR